MEERKPNILVNDEGCGLKKGDLLYKYTTLGEFTDVNSRKMKTKKFEKEYKDRVENLLQERQMWFSKYECLNDPYEIAGAYYDYGSKEGKSYLEISKLFNRSMVEILALTNSYNNLLMWSHYAKNHKGYCIEFVVEDASKIFKVQYLDKIPEGISLALLHAKDIEEKKKICKYFLNKPKAWEYENEYRVLNIDDWEERNQDSREKGSSIKLAEIGLKVNRIILGANCNKQLAKRIVEDCNKHNVPCVRAKICSDKYDIRIGRKLKRGI